jgi:ribosomal protein S18 acetylase RimI-like enzyme
MVTSSSPHPLLEAMEENLHQHIGFVQRSIPGMTVLGDEGLLLVDSGLASDTFNKVARARLKESEADRRIAEAVAHFARVRRPFAWWVGPGSRPLDIEKRLVDHGLKNTEAASGMAMEIRNLPAKPGGPRQLSVRRVTCLREITDFAKVFGANWEPPDPAVLAFYTSAIPLLFREQCPMKLFVGYLDGEPVAGCELFVSGGTAGLYSVCTRREFRRGGIGSVMVWVAADHARSQGIATVVLQSTNGAKGVYAGLGFNACGNFAEYAPGRDPKSAD